MAMQDFFFYVASDTPLCGSGCVAPKEHLRGTLVRPAPKGSLWDKSTKHGRESFTSFVKYYRGCQFIQPFQGC
jgi:hypothetical protein